MSKEIKFLMISFILSSFTIIVNSFSSNYNNYDNQCVFRNSLCDPSTPRSCCDQKDVCKQINSEHVFKCIEKTDIITLGQFCIRDEDCDRIRHSKCSTEKKCICRMNNIELNQTTCAPILGGFCWKSELCATTDAVCIDNECKCKDNYFRRSNNQCIFNTLGSHCETDENCKQVRFAKCTDHKICSCPSNTSAVNSTYCAPLIGGFCWTTDDCLPHNSTCVDNRCQCMPKYVPQSNNQCIQAYLYMPCEDNEECNHLVAYSICSKTKGCICDQNHFEKNHTECAPRIDHTCLNNSSCTLNNSICIDNVCQCKPGFWYKNFKCVRLYLNKPCKESNDCNRVKYSICSSDKKCACDRNFIQINKKTCRPVLDGFCSKDKDCLAINSTCIDNKCQCKKKFLRQSSHFCELPKLGVSCKHDFDCEQIMNSICSDDERCECILNHAEYNSTTCAPLLGGYCTTNKLCAPLNSICSYNICICDVGFSSKSNDRCQRHQLMMNCDINDDCKRIYDSKCLNHTCVCKDNYDMLNETTCAPLLGEYCKNNQQCAPANSICINNRCQCNLDYIRKFNNRCIAKTGYLRISCINDDHCVGIKYAKCSEDKKCVCKSNYVLLGDEKCIALIGEYCDSDEECISYNTVCINNKCECSEKFATKSVYQCERVSLGTTCETNYNCEISIKNAECSKNNKCICRQNSYALDEFECVSPLYEYCSNNEECRFNSSICIKNKCQCKDNFRSVSDSQCVPSGFLYHCDQVSDCGDPWHNKCSVDKRCICNKNNVLINKATCLPLLKGYCWIDHQCVVENSFCNDFRCECQRNFKPASTNLCIPGNFN